MSNEIVGELYLLVIAILVIAILYLLILKHLAFYFSDFLLLGKGIY